MIGIAPFEPAMSAAVVALWVCTGALAGGTVGTGGVEPHAVTVRLAIRSPTRGQT